MRNQYTDSQFSECTYNDRNIKELDVKIALYTKLDLSGKLTSYQRIELKLIKEKRLELGLKYNSLNCDKIVELRKLNETTDILSGEFELTDTDVLDTSKKENNILFISGGIILLVSIFLILKK
jgi:hypothetical protein